MEIMEGELNRVQHAVKNHLAVPNALARMD